MLDTLPYPFNDEIRGIAHAANVPLGMFIVITIFLVFILICFFTLFIAKFPKCSWHPPPFVLANVGEVVLFNIFYEVFTVCTSIVAEDSKGASSSTTGSLTTCDCSLISTVNG